MEQQHDSGLDAVMVSSQAAHRIRGAVKTGKAISSSAKGTAIGGPFGSVLGFALGNQNTGKILVAVIALLTIPVLLLCMLPSVIFGGISDPYSALDPENPILNSDIAVVENTNEICRRINSILSDALQQTLRNIDRHFNRSSADHKIVNNPYTSQISFDATKLVSMYCAYMHNDIGNISIDDLEQLIRNNAGRLFSYTYVDELREVDAPEPTEPDTTRPTESEPPPTDPPEPTAPETEVWRTYTVIYYGDALFADEIFSLAPEQQELANHYAVNLNLFLQDNRYNTSVNTSFQKNSVIDISQYTSPSTKNNLDLVQWAIAAERSRWGYVWGTYGKVLDSNLYAGKLQQYPTEVGRYSDFILANWLGGRTADCIGLIKGYGWLDPDTLSIRYGTNGMPDLSANSMYSRAQEKGPISTIPEIPGLAVWHTGHIGIYIGNGEVIEAMGTRYGVVRTQLSRGGWTHWLKIPYITYF